MYRLLILLSFLVSIGSSAGEYAKEANENPFFNGELNLKYEGELAALGGTVIQHTIVEGKNVYLLDLKIDNVKPIWVTSFIKPEGKPKVEIGIDFVLLLIGYIL